MNVVLDLNNPHISRVPYKQFIFKSGENHFQLLNGAARTVDIHLRYNNDNSIMLLHQAVDALRRWGTQTINLYMPYFPGSRQDRVCNEGEAFSLRIYANLINSLELSSVHIFDPHSDVTAALLDRVVTYNNHLLVFTSLDNTALKESILISPDAGANKKVFSLAKSLNLTNIVRADKVRDVTDGRIIRTDVFVDDLEQKPCIIVDDICSYGGTFKGLAGALKEKNAGDITLIVSHYEGVADLHSMKDCGISKIITTNSICSISSDDFIKQHDVFPFMSMVAI